MHFFHHKGGVALQFSIFYKYFLNTIRDWGIRELIEQGYVDIAEDQMESYLIMAFARFDNCHKNLNDFDLETKTLNVVLDNKETMIVVQWMKIIWAEHINDDLLLQQATVGDTDFKRTPQYMILRNNEEKINARTEKVQLEMINYDLLHVPFSEWCQGNYGI